MLVFEKSSLAKEIELLVEKFGRDRSSLLSILQEIQKSHRYISEYAQQEVSRQLSIHPVEVYSVISFYAFLNSEPKGRNIVRLCRTITCDMKDKESIEKNVETEEQNEIDKYNQIINFLEFSQEHAVKTGIQISLPMRFPFYI